MVLYWDQSHPRVPALPGEPGVGETPSKKECDRNRLALVDPATYFVTDAEGELITPHGADFMTAISYHPKYYHAFLSTQQFLMKENGPLPFKIRQYIAVIAAARHKCMYLAHLHTDRYVEYGGDKDWLLSLDSVPIKYRLLQKLNRLLAHRPWLVSQGLITGVVREEDRVHWSMGELMQAVVILCHTHALCSAVQGCEVVMNENTVSSSSSSSSSSSTNGTGGTEGGQRAAQQSLTDTRPMDKLYRKMRQLAAVSTGADAVVTGAAVGGVGPGAAHFKHLQTHSVELDQQREGPTLNFANGNGSSSNGNGVGVSSSNGNGVGVFPAAAVQGENERRRLRESPVPEDAFARLVDDPEYSYVNFSEDAAVCPEGESGLRAFLAEDGWLDCGFMTADKFYPVSGEILDRKFSIARSMTYNTLGQHEGVDTESFRQAVWNYTHCLLGIEHDGYDYREVALLLGNDLLRFIKTIVCSPESATLPPQKESFKSVLEGFQISEKTHVIVLIMEARLQAELVYALTAITRYMTSRHLGTDSANR